MTEAYRFGPFRLLVARRELLAHGVPVALGQRAFDLLLTLVSRRGELVTKDELMAEVWPGVVVEENNIQVHVSALRKLFATTDGGERYLLTVAGRGYRFVAPVECETLGPGPAASVGGAAPRAAVHNLPRQPAGLIGRENELADVALQLAAHPLVTLTGAGGVGKTRLALEVGRTLIGRYPDGVWLVELAPLHDPHLLAALVAEAVGASLSGPAATIDTLASALKLKELLLIIDNCEHVIAEAAHISQTLLRSCPRVAILATSRERLAIPGEWVIRVPSLPAPAQNAAIGAARAGEYAAVRLFVERASALALGFKLTDENAAAVGAICQRLDGIPLAIELAVPRLRVLPVQQLAARLDERFQLLTGGSRTALPRQQTLHALIDWSYGLLDEPEKLLLMRLSVFTGSAILESITDVVAGAELAPEQVPDLLLSLVEKSLVHADPQEEGTRYRLLESTRYYASEKLSGATELRRRHARHFAARLGRATAEWEATPTSRWMARYELDVDNLRGALEWAFGPGGDPAIGIDLVGRSHVLWAELGAMPEHRHWVKLALERTNKRTPVEATARLLSWQAGDVRDLDDPADHAEAVRAAALYRKLGDSFHQGRVLLRAGAARLLPDSANESKRLLRRAHALVKPSGPTKTLARCLSALASAHLFAGELDEARALHEQALGVYRELGEVATSAFAAA